MGLIGTIKSAFSGDNSNVDWSHVAAAFVIPIIIGMWIRACWGLVGELADFPPGVQLVIFTFAGVAPVSAAVNAWKARGTQTKATSIVTTDEKITETSQTKNAEVVE